LGEGGEGPAAGGEASKVEDREDADAAKVTTKRSGFHPRLWAIWVAEMGSTLVVSASGAKR
ncbi:hypothetical protein, partial [Dietzia sp. CW19]|uniref:hypothetical protein n=1 Tax=Dietzia sp. CW19 TaxID=1630634 RepID=UPI0019D5C27A